jgi:hypothetical protein
MLTQPLRHQSKQFLWRPHGYGRLRSLDSRAALRFLGFRFGNF